MSTIQDIMNASRASEAREMGENYQLEGAALQLVVRAGAQGRHERRVREAREAAEEAAERRPSVALALLLVEGVGSGGGWSLGDPDGLSRGTVRAAWAARLGKGRAHASDGAAWSAAIVAAVRDILADGESVIVTPTGVTMTDSGATARWEWILDLPGVAGQVKALAGRAMLGMQVAATSLAGVAMVEDDPRGWGAVYNLAAATAEALAAARDVENLKVQTENWPEDEGLRGKLAAARDEAAWAASRRDHAANRRAAVLVSCSCSAD